MDKLKLYINSLCEQDQIDFARSCGTSVAYIRKILSAKGRLFFGPAICTKIEINSGSVITRKDLRPHDWFDIWPELSDSKDQEAA